jgi:hypothetical protein
MMTINDGQDSTNTSMEYFADLPYESSEFAAEVFSFACSWVDFNTDNGISTRWIQNACLYQGVDPGSMSSDNTWDEDSFSIVGENGQLVNANYNDTRNLMQHILTMTVSTPPGIHAKAINDDTSSLVAAQTFDGVFGYYLTTHKSGRLMKQSKLAVEYSLIEDTGYMLCEWDKSLGDPLGVKMSEELDPMTGEQVPETDERGQVQLNYEGDLYFKARSPWDVFFDPGCQDEDEADWVLVRDQANKYEIAKRFPEHRTQILAASKAGSLDRLRTWRSGFSRPTKTNMIDVWKFYHRPTAGMPKGRYALLLDEATVLEDTINPYDRLPVFSIKAMEGLGSLSGYAPANIVAPVQQSRNILSSSMMTNFAMFGVQNVAVKDADQFDVEEIAGSMNVLRYADTPPQALQLAAQANGIDEHYDRLGRLEETLTGVNGVQRGDPEASLKSGKALGIVQAAGVQYNSSVAASYAQFLKDVGNFMLFCFRSFLSSQRITTIVGENDRAQSLTWDKDTFGPIDRVEAELVDPAMRTLGYKTDLGMFMVQNGMTTTPQEFLTVVTTGQLKPLYRAQLTAINLVHQENTEMMKAAQQGEAQWGAMQQQMQALQMQAQQAAMVNPALAQPLMMQAQQLQMQSQQIIEQLCPPVHQDDDDDMHMVEHAQVSAAPSSRRNKFLMAVYDAHRAAHKANKIQKAVEMAAEQVQVQAQTTQMAAQAGILPQAPMQAQGQPEPQVQAA